MQSYKGLFIVLALITSSSTALAEECDAILRDGVRNTYKTLQNGNFNSTFKQKFCDDYSSSKSGSSGGSAGVSWKLFSANGSTSNQKMESVSKSFCHDTDSQQSNANTLDVLQAIADDNIVAAWSSCMSNQTGLYLNGELNGKTLVIEYRMRSAGTTNTATVKRDPTVINATCDDAVKEGTVIDTGGVFQTCTRETDDPVTIVVNTSFQSRKFFIPAINKEDVKKPEPAASPPVAPACTINCLLPGNHADPRCKQPNGISIIGSVPC